MQNKAKEGQSVRLLPNPGGRGQDALQDQGWVQGSLPWSLPLMLELPPSSGIPDHPVALPGQALVHRASSGQAGWGRHWMGNDGWAMAADCFCPAAAP